MKRRRKYLEYLTEIEGIKKYLKISSKTEKTIRTYLLALDKFFPYLLNFFKENYTELKNFNLESYHKLNLDKQEKLKKEWEKYEIPNKIFEVYWKTLSSNEKAELLMKWVNELSNSNEVKRNTYLNYLWRIQGFLSKIGFEYKANSKNMDKINNNNGFHLASDITYEDVIKLYEKLDNIKYKLILKIMMYCGLNPADIILLRPMDFNKTEFKDNNGISITDYYILSKFRQKTKGKNTQYLIPFCRNFIEELKEYFERNIIIHLKKGKQDKKIDVLKKDNHFKISIKNGKLEETENYIKFKGKYNWDIDKNLKIFNNMKPNSIYNTLKYHRDKNNLNPLLMPMTIRRLCFTKLLDVISLKDRDIYDLWTQHKVGIIETHYIMNYLKRIHSYFKNGKIQEAVLIGNKEIFIKEINNNKKGIKEINVLKRRYYDLEKKIRDLSIERDNYKQSFYELNQKVEDLINILKEFDPNLKEELIKFNR